ncbi:hypothetical protein J0X19_10690 [Hymenobacter sp. BT186]|uniref:Uncharacterized protein n=1 Tax=Hymenobacter telluris TaxID=2816474 RepID=A0A939EWC8_9BACT|nr:hypothetical protein [Hymenobacter telluris]MBO0358412.1 hypothetical protein [Hymenobacter telluris]MBW3374438.1 hypothetical protein [Hymenobacter norwichensis]
MQALPFSPSSVRPYTSRTYQVQTDTSTRVRDRTVSNSITTTLRQTHYGRTKHGTAAVFVELLDFQQTDQSPLAVLLKDLNPVNNQLLFEVSAYGDLLAIRNLEEVQEQWRGLRPHIVAKYGRTAEGRAFIEGFEQRLSSDSLLSSFLHKGAYGILFPGVFNPTGPAGAIRWGSSERLMSGFFGSIDLPLKMHTSLTPDSGEPGPSQLHVTGEINDSRFDASGFQALVKQAMDMINFQVVHHLDCREQYDLDNAGWLTAGQQELTFTVDNFYHQYTRHKLKLV